MEPIERVPDCAKTHADQEWPPAHVQTFLADQRDDEVRPACALFMFGSGMTLGAWRARCDPLRRAARAAGVEFFECRTADLASIARGCEARGGRRALFACAGLVELTRELEACVETREPVRERWAAYMTSIAVLLRGLVPTSLDAHALAEDPGRLEEWIPDGLLMSDQRAAVPAVRWVDSAPPWRGPAGAFGFIHALRSQLALAASQRERLVVVSVSEPDVAMALACCAAHCPFTWRIDQLTQSIESALSMPSERSEFHICVCPRGWERRLLFARRAAGVRISRVVICSPTVSAVRFSGADADEVVAISCPPHDTQDERRCVDHLMQRTVRRAAEPPSLVRPSDATSAIISKRIQLLEALSSIYRHGPG